MSFGHGYGYGIKSPQAPGNGKSPSSLAGYYVGIEASSFDDPGGNETGNSTSGTHRQALTTAPVNLASGGPALTWHNVSDATRPIIHSGAWDTLLSSWQDHPDPNGEDWFGGNWDSTPPDSGFPSISQFGMDLASLNSSDARSQVYIGFHPTNRIGQLFRVLYGNGGINRIENSDTDTGRIGIKTSTFGLSNVCDMGDLRGNWYIWGYSWANLNFRHWLNGAEQTVSIQPTGNGIVAHDEAFYGSSPVGGYGCLHIWDQAHSDDDMNAVMSTLATRFGISYTFTSL